MKMSDNLTKYEVLIEQYLRSILDISVKRWLNQNQSSTFDTGVIEKR